MKVRATKLYFDKVLNRLVLAGEKLDVTEDRAKVLTSADVAELVAEPTPTTEKVAKPKPRKKND